MQLPHIEWQIKFEWPFLGLLIKGVIALVLCRGYCTFTRIHLTVLFVRNLKHFTLEPLHVEEDRRNFYGHVNQIVYRKPIHAFIKKTNKQKINIRFPLLTSVSTPQNLPMHFRIYRKWTFLLSLCTKKVVRPSSTATILLSYTYLYLIYDHTAEVNALFFCG